MRFHSQSSFNEKNNRLAMTMLACTRIGAVHSVVFAGFSAEALAQRVSAAQSQVLITADVGCRGGKTIPLKDIVNDSLTKMDCDGVVKHVLVWERFYNGDAESTAPYEMQPRDVRMDPLVAVQRPYCPPEHMDAEDNLFILYTSGSTGKPKGLLHTTGGYALFAKMTTQIVFDLHPGDLFACVADCGWTTGELQITFIIYFWRYIRRKNSQLTTLRPTMTGHTYVVYGPLLVRFHSFAEAFLVFSILFSSHHLFTLLCPEWINNVHV
jgi:acyl-coenzyme A synthetase/AMP-(fatty) acid ligase